MAKCREVEQLVGSFRLRMWFCKVLGRDGPWRRRLWQHGRLRGSLQAAARGGASGATWCRGQVSCRVTCARGDDGEEAEAHGGAAREGIRSDLELGL